MKFPWIVIAALMGASAVILGAVGAHAVAGDAVGQRYHNLAVSYQMFHIPALILVVYILGQNKRGILLANIAATLITVGVILFSGSLYYLGWTSESAGYNLTPMGGLNLICGWIVLAMAGFQSWRGEGSAQS
ncbi:MAG: DUF423 domain-containing protein [Sneathiella sp.]